MSISHSTITLTVSKRYNYFIVDLNILQDELDISCRFTKWKIQTIRSRDTLKHVTIVQHTTEYHRSQLQIITRAEVT